MPLIAAGVAGAVFILVVIYKKMWRAADPGHRA